MKSNQRAFTLTEILLVSAMFAVISVAVFNAFSNGFKLWARGQHVMVEGDMAIFLDKISEDLRQTVLITGIPFKGEGTQLSFPAIILARTDENGARANEGYGAQIGAVRYVYEPFEKKIYRSQAVYGQALKAQFSKPVLVASLIEDISLHYYFKADRGLIVKSETEEGIPWGVMIDVQMMVDNQAIHMHRFLIIPIGGGV